MIQHQIIGTYLQGNVKQLEERINDHIVGVNRLNFVSCKQAFFVKKKNRRRGDGRGMIGTRCLPKVTFLKYSLAITYLKISLILKINAFK